MAEPHYGLSHRLRPIVLLLLVATEQVQGLGCKNATYRTGVWLQKRNLSRPNRPRAARLGMLGRGRKTQTPATALGSWPAVRLCPPPLRQVFRLTDPLRCIFATILTAPELQKCNISHTKPFTQRVGPGLRISVLALPAPHSALRRPGSTKPTQPQSSRAHQASEPFTPPWAASRRAGRGYDRHRSGPSRRRQPDCPGHGQPARVQPRCTHPAGRGTRSTRP